MIAAKVLKVRRILPLGARSGLYQSWKKWRPVCQELKLGRAYGVTSSGLGGSSIASRVAIQRL
jgi:hypothetical protein